MTRLRIWTPGQWALRAVMVAGLLVALLATGPAGSWPAPWLVVLVGALGVAYALWPEPSFGTVAIGLVLAWWGLGLRDGLHPAALVAAAGLVASHVAGVVAAYGPDGMAVDRATVLLWARRGLLVFVLAPVVLGVALWVREQPDPGGIWVAGLAAALAAVVAAATVFLSGKVEE